MKTLNFSATIDAGPEKVWRIMLDPETYRDWTSVFAEGSYYEGSWNEGEKIQFLTPGGSGMTAIIAENRPNEFISIKHLGFIKDGVEDTESEAVRSWAPAFENYHLVPIGESTEVRVAQQVTAEYEDYMKEIWPKALAKLREICEAAS